MRPTTSRAALSELGAQLRHRSGAERLAVIDGRHDPSGHVPGVEVIDPWSAGADRRFADVASAGAVLVWTDPDLSPLDACAPTGALEALRRSPWAVIEAAPPLGEHLLGAGLEPAFVGASPAPWGCVADREVAVLWNDRPEPVPVPEDFRATAIMIAYNEQDVVRPSVERLLAQGLEVYLMDNWSTDGTPDLVLDLVGHGVVAVERFPPTGPSATYDWARLLERAEEVAARLDSQWCVLHDVDELRESPWPSLTLREALWVVHQAGYNAIDHSMIEFRPVDDAFVPGTPPWDHHRWFEFSLGSRVSEQVKGWYADPGAHVDLVSSGGHDARFPNRRVFPVNFLLRHYSIRGQRHGEQKVFRDRRPRLNEQEHRRNWHNHYDRVRRGHRFLVHEADLLRFDDDFYGRYLVPRLARVAMPQRPPRLPERARLAVVGGLRRAGLLATAVAVRRRLRDVISGRRRPRARPSRSGT